MPPMAAALAMIKLFFNATRKIGSVSMWCQCVSVNGEGMLKNP